MRLKELQALFWQESTRPEGDPRTVDAFVSDERLDAEGRIAIYADAYGARLLEVLRGDFPVTARLLGEQFDVLVAAFVREGPSVEADVARLALRFPTFLEGAARDVARLEAARVETFTAPDAAPLTLADLQALTPDEWPTLRLALVASASRIDTEHAVASLWEGGEIVGVGPEQFLVWRIGGGPASMHRQLDPLEVVLLEGIARGETFASLCERAAVTVGEGTAAQETGARLVRWISDGVITRA